MLNTSRGKGFKGEKQFKFAKKQFKIAEMGVGNYFQRLFFWNK